MRVRSPIGDMPFTITAVRVRGRELVIDGELGAWRSQIAVSAADLPMIAKALKTPLMIAAAVGVAAIVARRR